MQDIPLPRESPFYLLLMLQRRMRTLRLSLAPNFDTELGILLSMIPRSGGIAVGELAQLAGLSNSKLSRILARLQRQSILTLNRSQANHRTKVISVTEQGEQELTRLRELNNSLARLGTKPLNDATRGRLATLFRKLGDQIDSSNSRKLPLTPAEGEDPLVPQQRRLVALLGMTGAHFFNSSYSITAYQILLELLYASSPPTFAKFRAITAIDPPALSRELKALIQQGLVYRSKNIQDRRSPLFLLTPTGKASFLAQFLADEIRFNQMLGAFTDIERHELKSLLLRIVLNPQEGTLKPEFSAERCTEKEQFMVARKFLVEALVKDNRHSELESLLLPESSWVILLRQLGRVCGLIEIQRRSFGAELTQLELTTSINPTEIVSAIRATAQPNTPSFQIFVAIPLLDRWRTVKELVVVSQMQAQSGPGLVELIWNDQPEAVNASVS